MKQLDYQMNTNQSAELCVSGHCHILAGKGIPSMKALIGPVYNQDMTLSPTGYKTLAAMESVKTYYYNDKDPSGKTDSPRGNCTYGVGHLVKLGPCGDLLGKPVPEEQIQRILQKDVANAERIVRANVKKVELSQAKFDALVCFAFNTRHAQKFLSHVNSGWSDQEIVNTLLQYQKNAAGEFMGGLLKRSQWEAVAFGYNGPFYKNQDPPVPTWGS